MPTFLVVAVAFVWGALAIVTAGVVSGGYRDRRRFREARFAAAAAGQPPVGQPPVGQPPVGQPPVGQPPVGQPQDELGLSQAGQPPYELDRQQDVGVTGASPSRVGVAVPSYGEGLARQQGEGRTPRQRRAAQIVLVVMALALAGFGVLALRSGTRVAGVVACFAVAAMMVLAWTRRLAR